MIGRPRSKHLTCRKCGGPHLANGLCRNCYNRRHSRTYRRTVQDPNHRRVALLKWYESFCPERPEVAHVLRALWLYRLIAQRIAAETGEPCTSEDVMQSIIARRTQTASERN